MRIQDPFCSPRHVHSSCISNNDFWSRYHVIAEGHVESFKWVQVYSVLSDIFRQDVENGYHGSPKDISQHKMTKEELVLEVFDHGFDALQIEQSLRCTQMSSPRAVGAGLYLREEEQADVFKQF